MGYIFKVQGQEEPKKTSTPKKNKKVTSEKEETKASS
mgnify:FL=1